MLAKCLRPLLDAPARDFEVQLPGVVQIQVVVTPARTQCFWHDEAEDTFIAQTVGCKDYYFRENTVETTARFPPLDFDAGPARDLAAADGQPRARRFSLHPGEVVAHGLVPRRLALDRGRVMPPKSSSAGAGADIIDG